MEEKIIIVSHEFAKTRIDQFLANELDYSRSFIQNMIKKDEITVNGKNVKANYKVEENDEITIVIPEPEDTKVEAENINIDFLYQDKDIAIVNKPRGMVVHPAVGNRHGTLVNALLYHCKDLSGINGEIRPGIVHRLDKDTSGVMMVAKSDKAHIGLAEQIKEHSAKRKYYAIVHGNIAEEKATIKAPIGRHPKDRTKMAVVFKNSKEAVTHINVLERFGKYTLIECELETGRTHQIRVHLAYIGHPLVNDPVYGYKRMEFPINGQALHSRTLDLIHPITGEALHFEAPLPKDFLDCIEYAKKNWK